MNYVRTYEKIRTTRRHKLFWQTNYGLLRYIPTDSDEFILSVYDLKGNKIRTANCNVVSEGEITIVFPDDLPADLYTYHISFAKDKVIIHETVGVLRVERR